MNQDMTFQEQAKVLLDTFYRLTEIVSFSYNENWGHTEFVFKHNGNEISLTVLGSLSDISTLESPGLHNFFRDFFTSLPAENPEKSLINHFNSPISNRDVFYLVFNNFFALDFLDRSLSFYKINPSQFIPPIDFDWERSTLFSPKNFSSFDFSLVFFRFQLNGNFFTLKYSLTKKQNCNWNIDALQEESSDNKKGNLILFEEFVDEKWNNFFSKSNPSFYGSLSSSLLNTFTTSVIQKELLNQTFNNDGYRLRMIFPQPA